MRKVIISLFIFFFIFVSSPLFASGAKTAKKAPVPKHKIEFTTKDHYILVGDLYLAKPKTKLPLIIMLHSFGVNAKVWKPLAEKLRAKGYNVLAMDLRGHGRSVYNENLKLKSRYKFTNDDWQKLPSDILETVDYIKSNYPYINTLDTIMIASDLGASAGILAGDDMKKQPQKFVLISPMVNFKGLYIPVKIANYKNTKFLVYLAKSDKILFNFYTTEKPTIKVLPQGGPGNMLLKVNPFVNDEIINFITK